MERLSQAGVGVSSKYGTQERAQRYEHSQHHGYPRSVAFSPDGNTIAGGGAAGIIEIWNAKTGEIIERLEGRTGFSVSVVFSPDGETLASGSYDKTIKIWRVDTTRYDTEPDEETAPAEGTPTEELPPVEEEPDGTRDTPITLQGHTGAVYSVAFSPDGTKIASGSRDKTIKTWNANTGQYIETLQRHENSVSSVAVQSRWKTQSQAAAGTTTIKIWDANTGKLIDTLAGHINDVRSVAFSPEWHKNRKRKFGRNHQNMGRKDRQTHIYACGTYIMMSKA